MSIFTVIISIVILYEVLVAIMKKMGAGQASGKPSDSKKSSDGGSLRDILQRSTPETWREQIKQAFENSTKQTNTEPELAAGQNESREYQEYQVREIEEQPQNTEKAWEVERAGGVNETWKDGSTGKRAGAREPKAYGNGSGTRISVSEREVVQGVIWAEILGKPRGMRPFRGPRT